MVFSVNNECVTIPYWNWRHLCFFPIWVTHDQLWGSMFFAHFVAWFEWCKVHVLPREMFGFSTFGIAMALYKWFPIKVVDKILLLVTNFMLGNTNHYGIKRPKTGPIELKLATGKTPVLDVGQVAQIKCGNIKVC